MRFVGPALVAICGCGFSVAARETRDAAPDAPPDAAIDAPPDAFTSADCPLSYTLSHGLSRYLLVTTATTAWAASAVCASDLPGATHLVVFDDTTEQLQIQADVDATPGPVNQYWIGAVQQIDATQVGSGWLALTGGPLAGVWANNEPTDDDGGPPYDTEVHAEQFVRINRNGSGMVDAPGRIPGHGYICECDGRPIDPVAAQAISDSTGI